MQSLSKRILSYVCGTAIAVTTSQSVNAQQADPVVIQEPIVIEMPECPVPPPVGASELESYVWNDVCLYGSGQGYSVTNSDDICASDDPDQATLDTIAISEDFIVELLTNPDLIAVRASSNVNLSCLYISHLDLSDRRIPGGLQIRDSVIGYAYLGNTTVAGSLNFRGSFFQKTVWAENLTVLGNFGAYKAKFADAVEMLDVHVDGYMNFGGAKVAGPLKLGRAQISKDLFLRKKGSFAAVNLVSARIGGTLSANSSVFSGKIDGYGIEVGSDINLYGEATFKDVSFVDAKIGGALDASNSNFEAMLNANRLQVNKGIYLNNGSSFKVVQLRNADVGAFIELSDSTFSDSFLAQGIVVQGGAYFRRSNFQKKVELNGSKIEQHLQLQGSTFEGEVDLTEANLGSLLLWRGASASGEHPAADAKWGPSASLTLRNATAGALQARMPHSWKRTDSTWVPMDINGFRYDQLGGYSSGAVHDLAQVDIGPMIDWVSNARLSQAPGKTGYTPQPYHALQSALDKMGADSAARQVAYARLNHRAETRISASLRQEPRRWFNQMLGMIWDRFLQVTVGFGVYPQYALIWFILLVGVGTILARRSEQFTQRGGMDCFWYSLENAIPLIEPSDYHKVEHASSRIRSFFHFQKVSGFVLATVLIGAVTLGG